jgi:ribonuclease-3
MEVAIGLKQVFRSMRRWLVRVGDPTRPLEDLQSRLQYGFHNPDLLEQALKHRSYVYAVEEGSMASNERLEFLGDAVLDLIITEYLFRRFHSKREGELTQIKSLLVSKVVLAEKGRDIGLGDFLFLSKEEIQSGGRKRTSIIGDAFEALLGAIYLDGGLGPARGFIERVLLAEVDDIISDGNYLNFKSVLLEHTQSEGQGHPRYLVSAEEGPDHRKIFSVEVLINGDRLGEGQGRSKKEAQQMAAKAALKHLGLH